MHAASLPEYIHWIRLPLANTPLHSVNAYLIESDEGCALVDCGWDTPDTLEALQAALRSLGHDLGDVRTLVATHFHIDHAGLSARLVRLSGARFLIHRMEWDYFQSHMADPEATRREILAWLERHGMSLEGWSERAKAQMLGGAPPELATPDVLLEEGDRVQVGEHHLQVLWTPGHTQGHLCLYDPEGRALFSGDHVLDPINPHVGSRPGMETTLAPYLDALERVAALGADVVLPGHGEPFRGLRGRAEKLLAHHRQRQEAVLETLARGRSTAGEIAEAIPWTNRRLAFRRLPPLNQRVALGQILAHLEMLRDRGEVSREDGNGLVYYERKETPA